MTEHEVTHGDLGNGLIELRTRTNVYGRPQLGFQAAVVGALHRERHGFKTREEAAAALPLLAKEALTDALNDLRRLL